MNEKIYLDKSGYEKYLKEIEELRNRLNNNSKMKSEAYVDAVGDGWHDNFLFEDAKREEYKILGLLREKIAGLSRIVVVDSVSEKNGININDFITLNLMFPGEEPEELEFKLVASNSPEINTEISLNSPLGKAVYQKQIGDSGSYIVNGNNISFVIVNVIKDYENSQQVFRK